MTHEQVFELEPGGGFADLPPAALADLDDLAGRKHDLEADHQVTGVAVATADERPTDVPMRPPTSEHG